VEPVVSGQPVAQRLRQYRDYMQPDSPLVAVPPPASAGSRLDVGGLDDALEAAGFTVGQRSYRRESHYDREQWLDLVFTYSTHLVLPPDSARELRSRLAERIGAGGVTVSGDTLLVTARPRTT
jgi:hypothetical protein